MMKISVLEKMLIGNIHLRHQPSVDIVLNGLGSSHSDELGHHTIGDNVKVLVSKALDNSGMH